MKNQNRNSLIVLVILTVLFLGVLVYAIEALASGNGVALFISAAILWLLGTIIKNSFVRVKPFIVRLPHEDAPMDMEIKE